MVRYIANLFSEVMSIRFADVWHAVMADTVTPWLKLAAACTVLFFKINHLNKLVFFCDLQNDIKDTL